MQPSKIKEPLDVLIVGAGPSGLMMACQLALHRISFRIIDKKEKATDYSGALIVHARTLEIFRQMGIRDAIREGIVANTIKFIFNGKKPMKMVVKDISRGLSEFPYLLMLEQSKTEIFLIDFINKFGKAIERRTELISFTQNKEGVTTVVKLPNGEEESIKSKYLIGADGGHSKIREQLNIPFVGTTHEISLFVTDCYADLDFLHDEVCFSFSERSATGFFPLKNGGWRIDGTIQNKVKGKKTLTFEDIRTDFAERKGVKFTVSDGKWFSIFHSHQCYAASFRQGCCFLVGDAAHVHSPVGAQGMNTGLQDAYNLAWKLAFVIQQRAKRDLLDSYQAERMPISKKTINTTEKVFKLIVSDQFITRKLRTYIIPFLMKLLLPVIERKKKFHQFLFQAISGVGISYKEGLFVQNASLGNFPVHSPKPGCRFPYLVFNNGQQEVNIQEKIKATEFHLFIFAKNKTLDAITELAGKYNVIVSIEMIPYSEETKKIYQLLGISNSGIYFIRPDMYIAYRANRCDVLHFENFLKQFV